VEWRPTEAFLIRGSYAQAFAAPSLFSLYSPQIIQSVDVTDPLNGNAAVSPLVTSGGNLTLRPETGQSRSLGVVWSPEAVKALRVSITYWVINQTSRVQSQPDPQEIIDSSALFPGRIVRGPSVNGQVGDIQSVDATAVNFGSLRVSGFDGELTYGYHTSFGVLTPSVSVTRTYKYEAAITPNAPITDRLSLANEDGWAPRWKGMAALGWKMGPYSAGFDGRYVGKYQDYVYAGTPTRQLGDFWLYDLNARYDFGAALAHNNRYLKGTYIAIGGVNIFNSLPKFSDYGDSLRGYDATQYDIRGRFLYANLGAKW